MKRKYLIVGLDEVGRGPLAGPVTVAAVILTKKFSFSGLKDSKKLSERQRNSWFQKLKKSKGIFYAVSSVSPRVIDRINIAKAANLAAARAFQKLVTAHFPTKMPLRVYLDGGLYLKQMKIPNKYEARTIIKGDERINAIKLASIVAKVSRDSRMKRLHKKYPVFGFAVNKGYGTKTHFTALRKSGFCGAHRLTFLRHYLKYY